VGASGWPSNTLLYMGVLPQSTVAIDPVVERFGLPLITPPPAPLDVEMTKHLVAIHSPPGMGQAPFQARTCAVLCCAALCCCECCAASPLLFHPALALHPSAALAPRTRPPPLWRCAPLRAQGPGIEALCDALNKAFPEGVSLREASRAISRQLKRGA